MTQRVVTLIKTHNLSKTYHGVAAVKDVSLDIRAGTMLLIAGPNGGGKTTVLDCLSGLIEPDDPAMLQRPAIPGSRRQSLDVRRTIGYIPDADDTIEFLTALEYCQLVAAAYKRPIAATVQTALDYLRRLDFHERHCTRLIAGFSHGMKKKLQLAAMLAVQPPLIIIDEPTNGLDPTAILLLKQLLKDPALRTSAFVVATHHLAFAAALGGTVLLLQQRPIAYGECQSLLAKHHVTSLEALYEQLVSVTI